MVCARNGRACEVLWESLYARQLACCSTRNSAVLVVFVALKVRGSARFPRPHTPVAETKTLRTGQEKRVLRICGNQPIEPAPAPAENSSTWL